VTRRAARSEPAGAAASSFRSSPASVRTMRMRCVGCGSGSRWMSKQHFAAEASS
jgi:hypothetical protein